jgi:hypothetical protein
MVRRFQWGILERRTRTDLCRTRQDVQPTLEKRVKGCTVPILADKSLAVPTMLSYGVD